jgi:hypothetical protein
MTIMSIAGEPESTQLKPRPSARARPGRPDVHGCHGHPAGGPSRSGLRPEFDLFRKVTVSRGPPPWQCWHRAGPGSESVTGSNRNCGSWA